MRSRMLWSIPFIFLLSMIPSILPVTRSVAQTDQPIICQDKKFIDLVKPDVQALQQLYAKLVLNNRPGTVLDAFQYKQQASAIRRKYEDMKDVPADCMDLRVDLISMSAWEEDLCFVYAASNSDPKNADIYLKEAEYLGQRWIDIITRFKEHAPSDLTESAAATPGVATP